MDLGKNIRAARIDKKYTQEELARKIGVSKNAISNYETGISTPKLEILFALMVALEVDANYIYGIPDATAPLQLTPHERELVLAYRQQKEMQASVDRLLQIEPALTSRKNA